MGTKGTKGTLATLGTLAKGAAVAVDGPIADVNVRRQRDIGRRATC